MDPYYGVIDHRNPYSNVFTEVVEALKIWCGQTVYRKIFLLKSLKQSKIFFIQNTIAVPNQSVTPKSYWDGSQSKLYFPSTKNI